MIAKIENERVAITDDDGQDLGAIDPAHAVEFGTALVEAGKKLLAARPPAPVKPVAYRDTPGGPAKITKI